MERLTRAAILRALEALALRLPADSSHHLVVVGGAALVILYGVRESTKDVDAFLLGAIRPEILREAAAHVAQDLGLPTDWLNDAAKGYVHGLAMGDRLLSVSNLTVDALAPQQLLAMKLSAWRDDLDVEDARVLLTKLQGGREEVWSRIEPHLVPGRELKAQYAFADLWEARHGPA